jgi:hypothetical protein
VSCEAARNTIEASKPDTDDRRINQRFSLRLAIKFRRIERRAVLDRIIIGESLNISSKGLLFTATEAFLPGQIVEAFIDWPMLLDSRVRLTLVVEGVILWAAENKTAMSIEKYQFKTRPSAKVRSGSREAVAPFDPEQQLLFNPRASG